MTILRGQLPDTVPDYWPRIIQISRPVEPRIRFAQNSILLRRVLITLAPDKEVTVDAAPGLRNLGSDHTSRVRPGTTKPQYDAAALAMGFERGRLSPRWRVMPAAH
jgi:hypothetical protein